MSISVENEVSCFVFEVPHDRFSFDYPQRLGPVALPPKQVKQRKTITHAKERNTTIKQAQEVYDVFFWSLRKRKCFNPPGPHSISYSHIYTHTNSTL